MEPRRAWVLAVAVGCAGLGAPGAQAQGTELDTARIEELTGLKGTVIEDEGVTYGKKTPVPSGAWSTLAVGVRGNLFEVSFNGKKLYEVEDATLPEAGKVGLWTKADSVMRFDDLSITTH